jgi:hypothetical protein
MARFAAAAILLAIAALLAMLAYGASGTCIVAVGEPLSL